MALTCGRPGGLPCVYPQLNETRRRQIRFGALAVDILLLATGVILFLDGGQRTASDRRDRHRPCRVDAPPLAALFGGSRCRLPLRTTGYVSSLQRDQAVT